MYSPTLIELLAHERIRDLHAAAAASRGPVIDGRTAVDGDGRVGSGDLVARRRLAGLRPKALRRQTPLAPDVECEPGCSC
jgi:hypothetical protein